MTDLGESSANHGAVADRFLTAIERGDIERVAELYADDVGVWHNYDQVEQDKQASLRTLSWLTRRFGLLRYVDVRRTELAGGFWQQHVTELSHRGKVIRIPAALRVYCRSDPDRADRGVCRPGPVRSPGARCPRRPRLAPPTRRSGLARTRVRARLSDPWL